MSKDNTESNYSSTNYAKNLIKNLIEKKKNGIQKMHLQANGFKGLERTFTNNGV
jgi:hypothetical protein